MARSAVGLVGLHCEVVAEGNGRDVMHVRGVTRLVASYEGGGMGVCAVTVVEGPAYEVDFGA